MMHDDVSQNSAIAASFELQDAVKPSINVLMKEQWKIYYNPIIKCLIALKRAATELNKLHIDKL